MEGSQKGVVRVCPSPQYEPKGVREKGQIWLNHSWTSGVNTPIGSDENE
ncbi:MULTISPECIES: hypothetical protein [Sulfolobaceae]|nr:MULTISPECIES: hypothetical protein [unclassified Sulfolobus]